MHPIPSGSQHPSGDIRLKDAFYLHTSRIKRKVIIDNF